MTVHKNIRLAKESDSSRLLEIYSPFIKNTVISFELEIPSVSEFKERVTNTLQRFPWLVCEIDGNVVGYAYASEHRKRAAYSWSVDFSVYVDPCFHRKGIATALYSSLIQLLKLQGYYNAYAGVTVPNVNSESFHAMIGFQLVGVYHNVGYKFGEWRDVKWFELTIAEHSGVPVKPKTLVEIRDVQEFNEIIKKGIQLIKA